MITPQSHMALAAHNPPVALIMLSDGAGIAAESLALTALTQFGTTTSERILWPFYAPSELGELKERMTQLIKEDKKVILVSTLAMPEERKELFDAATQLGALHLDAFDLTIGSITAYLNIPVQSVKGLARGRQTQGARALREGALDWTLAHDDGQKTTLTDADVLIMGPSRSGKTPVCIWLALHYSIKAANYPITPDDLQKGALPNFIERFSGPKISLTLSAERLMRIRSERLGHASVYASEAQCQKELLGAARLASSVGAHQINSENKSVEEMAAHILRTLHWSPQQIF